MYSAMIKKRKNNKKNHFTDFRFAALCCGVIMFTACNPLPPLDVNTAAGLFGSNSDRMEERYDREDTWAFYWYLCGSDLESRGGFGTADLEEMLSVKLPENITVVVETGGTLKWQSDIDARSNSRYVYDSKGWRLLEKIAASNMGDNNTLETFLRFCNRNYPADHKAVILWDHGGGSTSGVVFDEKFNYDSLSLPEIREAFEAVNVPSQEAPPYEMIGLDACLMSTVDMVAALNGFGRFMVASQESEPANGWDYEALFQALADDSGMNGAKLGMKICDSFYAACEEIGAANTATLAVTDLSCADALKTAYDNVGAEALMNACITTDYITKFGRAARAAESFEPNNPLEGYTNMVDLTDLVRKCQEGALLPEYGEALLDVLNESVLYRVNGQYRNRSGGLSCYYSYDSSYRDFAAFEALGMDSPFYWFYEYSITGDLSQEGQEILQSWVTVAPKAADWVPRIVIPGEVEIPEASDLNNYPVSISDTGYAVLELGAANAAKLVDVYCSLAYYYEAEDLIVFLGMDNDLIRDWEKGHFTDNFRGVWGSIDDVPVYMDIIDVDDDYHLCAVPILLNGEEYSLRVSYSYETQGFEILGARKGLDKNGMSDKQLRRLIPGDVIEPVLYMLQSESYIFEEVVFDQIKVTEETGFAEADLGDGTFYYMFEMVDVQNNSYFSEVVKFEVLGEEIDIVKE